MTTYEVINVSEWNAVEEIFANDEEIILDYEGSGLNTYHENYYVGGLALKAGPRRDVSMSGCMISGEPQKSSRSRQSSKPRSGSGCCPKN
jgi:hypothetical protein